MSFKVNMTGIDDLKNRLKNLDEVLKKEVQLEIEATGYDIESDAKSLAPVDEGFLRQSINNLPQQNGTMIEASAGYAAYVEFGTGAGVSVPPGVNDYAITFKGSGKRKHNQSAQPFMFPAYFKNKLKLVKRLKEKLDKV